MATDAEQQTESDRSLFGARLLHTMIRVGDLQKSLDFYSGALGMKQLRREDYSSSRFTLVFVGYGDEAAHTVIELTHNWDDTGYTHGSGFGHIAIRVNNIQAACERLASLDVKILRPPGHMAHTADKGQRDIIAFVEDPDGYKIELIEKR